MFIMLRITTSAPYKAGTYVYHTKKQLTRLTESELNKELYHENKKLKVH